MNASYSFWMISTYLLHRSCWFTISPSSFIIASSKSLASIAKFLLFSWLNISKSFTFCMGNSMILSFSSFISLNYSSLNCGLFFLSRANLLFSVFLTNWWKLLLRPEVIIHHELTGYFFYIGKHSLKFWEDSHR